jgi:hypothetical protein
MPTREERIRNRLFPGVRTFPRATGGFAALPIILRRAQFAFRTPRHWQLYTYVLMRAGPAGVAWFNLAEMAWDLDFKSIAKLKPYVDDLVTANWLLRQSSRGQDYYVVPDPLGVLAQMHKDKKLPADRVEEIDALAEALGHPTLDQDAAGEGRKKAPAANAPAQEKAG